MSADRRDKSRRSSDAVALEERTLPQNLEAERSVLGAILLHNDAYETAARYVQSGDFFRAAHRLIFSCFVRLLDRPQGLADFVTIKNDLASRGELDEVGGPTYLSALVDGVPRSSNIQHYAGIVKEKALLRALIFASNKTLAAAYDAEESSATILGAADQALASLQAGHTAGRMRDLRSSAGELFDDLSWRHAHKGELTGVPTGFKSLDDLTSGWQAGDLIIVAARPSIGKTTFVMNSAAVGAVRNHIATFSLEMRRKQLEYRMLSSLSKIPATRLIGGYIMGEEGSGEWIALSNALALQRELHIHIDDTAARTVQDIRRECRRLKAEHGLSMVVVDYIQLMTGSLERRGVTRTEELADISRRLKVMADELAVPVIVLSQLRRLAGGRPQLDDLRECGALEQDSDIVIFLHRKNHREGGTTQLILEKQRNGPTGTVNVSLDRDILTFTDGGETPAEEVKAVDEEEAKARKTQAIIRNRARRK